MSRLAIVELHKEELKFSAGHFMLFSASERESMHGHDYQIHVAFNTLIQNNGMAFDCRLYKQRVLELCKTLDYRFILPAQSEFLQLKEAEDKWIATIGKEILTFLKKDSVVLPICNATLEELSFWFLTQLTKNDTELNAHNIKGIAVKVFNGRGESGTSNWGQW